jgi:hypothetical protein
MLESCGALVSSPRAEDLVADAIGDTWQGHLTWNPDELSLVDHVKGAVRSRVRAEWRRAKRFAHVSLDVHESDEDDERATSLWSEAEEALGANVATSDASDRIFAGKVLDRLHGLAAGDTEIEALLDAMRAGATERAELIRMTGMSTRRYESARRRLDRLLMELPASWQEHAQGAPADTRCANTAKRRLDAVPGPVGLAAGDAPVPGHRHGGTPGLADAPRLGSAAVRALCCAADERKPCRVCADIRAGARTPEPSPSPLVGRNNSLSIPTARSSGSSHGVLVEDLALASS